MSSYSKMDEDAFDQPAVITSDRAFSSAKREKEGIRNRRRAKTTSLVMTAALREQEENDLEENFLLLEDGNEERVAKGGHSTNSAPHLEPVSTTTKDDDTEFSGRSYRGSCSGLSADGKSRKKEDKWDAVSDAAFSVACGILDVLPNSFAKNFVKELTVSELQYLDSFQQKELVPYSKENPQHVEMLGQFWDACMVASHRYKGGSALVVEGLTPELPPAPEELKSEVWKTYGFQNIDPASDFRGGGAFSLKNLLYFAETYPTSFGEVATSDYPFAIAGINITMMLLNLMKLTHGKETCLATTQKNEKFSSQTSRVRLCRIIASQKDDTKGIEVVFGEIYSTCIYIMHQQWLGSKRNLLEFNSILKTTKEKVDVILRNANKLGDISKHGKLVQ